MLSRRRSEVWERKGSMERARDCRFGVRGAGAALRAWRDVGSVSGLGDEEEEEGGRVCKYEVNRWELWMVRGSSSRISW